MLSIVAMGVVTGLYGCGNTAAYSASTPVSPTGSLVSTSPAPEGGPPAAYVCQPILSAADLAGAATESDVVVEGTSPDKPSVFNDSDASQFNVTKVLKALPGVDPVGTIEIVFGPPNSGDYLPAGQYLMFLQYNPIGNDYTIAGSSTGFRAVTAEFLIDGDTATEKRCAAASLDGAAPSAVASWYAVASAPPMSATELEGFVGGLTLGRVPVSSNPAVVDVCKAQNLQLTNPPSLDSGMGGRTVEIVFQNTGTQPCSLIGWPTITTPGMRTKVQYQTTTGAGFTVPVSRVVLGPGESGSAALDLFGVPGSTYSQECFGAGSWAVTPPGSSEATSVPWPKYQGACPGGTVEVSPVYIPDPKSVTGFSSADPAAISQLGPFDSPPASP
jgi:hypothetical protein